jgi:hypothetical protein
MRPMTCPTLLDDSTANNAIPHGNDRCGNPDRRHTLVSPIRRRLASPLGIWVDEIAVDFT